MKHTATVSRTNSLIESISQFFVKLFYRQEDYTVKYYKSGDKMKKHRDFTMLF